MLSFRVEVYFLSVHQSTEVLNILGFLGRMRAHPYANF